MEASGDSNMVTPNMTAIIAYIDAGQDDEVTRRHTMEKCALHIEHYLAIPEIVAACDAAEVQSWRDAAARARAWCDQYDSDIL